MGLLRKVAMSLPLCCPVEMAPDLTCKKGTLTTFCRSVKSCLQLSPGQSGQFFLRGLESLTSKPLLLMTADFQQALATDIYKADVDDDNKQVNISYYADFIDQQCRPTQESRSILSCPHVFSNLTSVPSFPCAHSLKRENTSLDFETMLSHALTLHIDEMIQMLKKGGNLTSLVVVFSQCVVHDKIVSAFLRQVSLVLHPFHPVLRTTRWLFVSQERMRREETWAYLNLIGNIIVHRYIITPSEQETNRVMDIITNDTMYSSKQVVLTSRNDQCPLSPSIQGKHLIVSVNMWSFFVVADKVNGTVSYSGYSIDLLKLLANHLNFTYTIVVPLDGLWGDLNSGEWSGIIGQFHRKEIDMSVAPLTLHKDREQVVDSVLPPMDNMPYVIIRRKAFSEDKMYTLVHPITYGFFLEVLLPFLAIIGLALVIHVATSGCTSTPAPPACRNLWPELSKGIKDGLMKYICFHETVSPPCFSGRLLRFTWSIFFLVTFGTYCACLVASFTSQRIQPPFRGFEELVNSETFTFGSTTAEQGIFGHILRASKDPVFKKAWRKMLTWNKTDPQIFQRDPAVHFKRMLNPDNKYAVLTYSVSKRGYDNITCYLEDDPEFLYYEAICVALQKGSPYRRELSQVMSKLTENGVLQKLKEKYLRKSDECHVTKQQREPITVEEILILLYTVAGCLGASVIAFLIEFYLGKYRKTAHKAF